MNSMDELELIDDLVESLQRSKSIFQKVGGEASKERFLDRVFQPMNNRYDGHVLRNLRILINHHLFVNCVNIDDVIHFLRELNKYDARIIEREKIDSFDLKYGTVTGVIESSHAHKDFASDYELLSCTRTVPTAVRTIYSVLQQLGELNLDLKDYSFMDIGSGMGRNLLIASLYPFKSVVGVEISKSINDIAENNIKVFSHPDRKCYNVNSYATDILDFELPYGNMVMFFFEPFSQSVFSQFYPTMLKTIQEANAHYVLIFLGKVFSELSQPSSIFKLVHTGFVEEISATSYNLHFYSNK
jgi:Histone methylation protein DOT1